MVDGICTRCLEPTVYHAKPSGNEAQLGFLVAQNDSLMCMNSELFVVQTYLCGSCGYLEQHANRTATTSGAPLLETLAASESTHWRRVEPT